MNKKGEVLQQHTELNLKKKKKKEILAHQLLISVIIILLVKGAERSLSVLIYYWLERVHKSCDTQTACEALKWRCLKITSVCSWSLLAMRTARLSLVFETRWWLIHSYIFNRTALCRWLKAACSIHLYIFFTFVFDFPNLKNTESCCIAPHLNPANNQLPDPPLSFNFFFPPHLHIKILRAARILSFTTKHHICVF